MERASWVLSFDLATRTGWAMGAPGDKAPISGSVTLEKKGGDDGDLENNIGVLFVRLAHERKPDIVIWEVPFTIGAWWQMCQRQGRFQNGDSLIIQNTLAGIMRRECRRKEIPFVQVARQTILKHYTGQRSWSSAPGAMDGRELGKKEILKRAATLGHLPHGCKDDDRGDAVAMWDWGCAVYGRATPESLELFSPDRMRFQPKKTPLDG